MLRHLLPALLLCSLACRGQTAEEGPGPTPPTTSAESIPANPPAPTANELVAKPADDPPAPAPPPAAAPEPRDPVGPLTEEERRTLLAGSEDATFPVDIHYIQSNETRHDLFFPYIAGIGGAFIGVGSDQSFTMIAHAKSELVFMMDIDYRVIDLQRIYEVLVPAAESAQALVDAFESKNGEATQATLETAFADLEDKDRKRILQGFRNGRETVYRHLLRVISRQRDGQPTSWLSDPDKFAHIKKLYENGRVRIMAGNLAGAASIKSAAAACKELGVTLRILYMSNAEEYFDYIRDFVDSVSALPIDERSVVLRTIYSKKWEHADLWAYQVQPLSDFVTRLGDKRNRSRSPMLRLADNDGSLDKHPGPKGLSLVGKPAEVQP